MQRLQWTVLPLSTPAITRPCRNCGGMVPFTSSGKFRMNSNGPRMDVWLIYKCDRCDTTWKLTLHTGILPREIPEQLFKAYQDNCAQTAERLAFDRGLLKRNGVEPIYEGIELDIAGDDAPDGPFEAVIDCPYAMDIRVTRILSAKMGLSRSEIERRIKHGRLSIEGGGDLRTLKLPERLVVVQA